MTRARSRSGSPRVGLVLGGGGVTGYGFHVGVLDALAKQTGWDARTAEVIIGTSAGSIAGGLLRAGLGPDELRLRALRGDGAIAAADPSTAEAAARAAATLDEVTGRQAFRVPKLWGGPWSRRILLQELWRGPNLRLSNVVLGALPQGRIPTAPVRELVAELGTETWPLRPLWIPATNAHTGRRVVLGRDRIDIDPVTAVEASCAVPGYFVPVSVGDETFVDGGIHSSDNADLLLGADVDLALVLAPLSVGPNSLVRSPVAAGIRLYPRSRLRENVGALRKAGLPVMVVEPDEQLVRAMGVNAMDPGRLAPLLDQTASFLQRHLARLDETGQTSVAALAAAS